MRLVDGKTKGFRVEWMQRSVNGLEHQGVYLIAMACAAFWYVLVELGGRLSYLLKDLNPSACA